MSDQIDDAPLRGTIQALDLAQLEVERGLRSQTRSPR
jgi:hypothetical protein